MVSVRAQHRQRCPLADFVRMPVTVGLFRRTSWAITPAPDGCAHAAVVFVTGVCRCFRQESGRLLYAGQDDWVHSNCALWSAEVFEADDGCMHNVHLAMVRGRQLV